ncbi:MAG: polysaccharide pyruvyl transferase family protein [Pirellulales bacterium]|nr:polysaccharide pyruvyl transferase family protein [Pirellulales bacterium]
MRLLSPEYFAKVMDPLRGKRIGYVRPVGNVGDQLIEWATFQLFDKFGIHWNVVSLEQPPNADELVFGGGGNMGSFYQANWNLREKAMSFGIPMTILPQSFMTAEDRPFHRVYLRERRSFKFCPTGIFAPDLALGLEYANSILPQHDLGVFIRRDCELKVKRPWLTRDPVRLCKTPQEYLQLAAQYRRIITDRLHFAISGLILRRETTILPNSYHKNRGMYEAWLGDLGCSFAEDLEAALDQRPTILSFFTGWTARRPSQKAAA